MGEGNGVLVRAHGLTKRYGRMTAVDNLDMEIQKGEIFGFLGPNGAGKTTTIRMMLGLIAPSAGAVEVFGRPVGQHLRYILDHTGAMVEEPAFYPYLSARDNLTIMAETAGIKGRAGIEGVLELVDLSQRAGDKFKTYSQGMKQRLAMAAALLNDPELVILDEPTNGLDPAGMVEVRALIRRLGDEGKTVFLSSHLLHEVEQVCDRVAIVQKGKVVAQGSVQQLLNGKEEIEVYIDRQDAALSALRELDWVELVPGENAHIVVHAPLTRSAEINAHLAQRGLYASQIVARKQTLEQYFLDVTGGD